jgi:hypothetical protein
MQRIPDAAPGLAPVSWRGLSHASIESAAGPPRVSRLPRCSRGAHTTTILLKLTTDMCRPSKPPGPPVLRLCVNEIAPDFYF